MRFVADEGVDRPIVERLRSLRHDVECVAEYSPSISDAAVLLRANEIGAILVTQDKDFGELVFRQGRVTNGILLLRLAGLSPEDKPTIVGSTIAGHEIELAGAFSVLTQSNLRIRRF